MRKIIITTLAFILASQPVYAANTKSIDLDRASSQWLSITDASQTGLDITGDLSFMAWVKIDQLPSTAGGNFGLFGKWKVAASREGYMWQSQGDVMQLRYDVGGATTYADSDAAFWVAGDVGVWRHVAVTVDVSAKAIVMYKDASIVASTNGASSAASIGDNAQPFLLGRNWATDSQYLDGLMDEVGMYNAVLSGATITSDYNSGSGTERSSGESSIVGGWRFEDNRLDETANNNDLTDNGGTTFSADTPFGAAAPATPVIAEPLFFN